jgi:hypothetical protein
MKTSTLLLILFSINLVACLGDEAPEEKNTEETPISIISNLNNCSSQPPSTTGLVKYQIVYDGCIAWNGDTGTAIVRYISDDAETTGLGIRVHYDSASMSFKSANDVLDQDLTVTPVDQDDSVENHDENNDTDFFINVAWASVFGNWPQTYEADLVTLTFEKKENADGNYYLKFTSSSTASGFQFNP